ncbi:GNAT family N-acetyltransferase [Azospirillum melinis]|uniref:GNAT family N-acetyltransferase n=1 Tax=Azospirillum melinis TaxID=328839 RepID=A0ABX2K996_9PROT|nr:N-acetyltransferase [Azospirillum melinis]MBP2306240.1 putative N-acetyltransferase YhbS [Azospirillum melinis]NUB00185.1 GNAT family N-acetyltransferase [Azospirillum melinis]
MIITVEEPKHAAAIEALLDASFGPDRFNKTAYRLRDGVDSIPALNLVAIEHDEHGREVVVGTIRYWPILVGGATPSILLGPIAVAAHLQGSGLGSKMIRMSLNKAVALGHKSVILVGDAPYYERFGFSRALTLGMQMPGPVDMSRLLGLELVEGSLAGGAGMIGKPEQADAQDVAIGATPVLGPVLASSIDLPAGDTPVPFSALFSRTAAERVWTDRVRRTDWFWRDGLQAGAA